MGFEQNSPLAPNGSEPDAFRTHATLVAEDIAFSYPKGPMLYDGFSFEAGSEERIALVGPSGAGKTTLCMMLAGYLAPARGRIKLEGCGSASRPPGSPDPVQLVGQHPELALDPRMRMSDSLKEAGEPDPGIISRLGIESSWLNRFPHELSGGELQRFCIARALIAKPRFLVADEITTMLDAVSQAQIWHALLEYASSSDMGIVFVSHSPELRGLIATRIVEV